MTSIKWLFKNLKSHFEHNGDLLEVVKMSFEQAEEMHKKESFEFWNGGIKSTEEGGKSFDQYHEDNLVEIPTSSQTTSDKWKEYQDWLNNKID
jgi:hypothetical protein